MQKAKHLLLVLVLAANAIVVSSFIWLRASNGLAWQPLVATSGGVLVDRTRLDSGLNRGFVPSATIQATAPRQVDNPGLQSSLGQRTWGSDGLGGYLRDPALAKPAADPLPR